jgi:hypothetical protein
MRQHYSCVKGLQPQGQTTSSKESGLPEQEDGVDTVGMLVSPMDVVVNVLVYSYLTRLGQFAPTVLLPTVLQRRVGKLVYTAISMVSK